STISLIFPYTTLFRSQIAYYSVFMVAEQVNQCYYFSAPTALKILLMNASRLSPVTRPLSLRWDSLNLSHCSLPIILRITRIIIAEFCSGSDWISARYSITSRSLTASLSTEYCAPSKSISTFFTRTFSGSVFSAFSATCSTSAIAHTSHFICTGHWLASEGGGPRQEYIPPSLGSNHYSDEGNVNAPGNVLLPGVVIPPTHLHRFRCQASSRSTPEGHPTRARQR